MIQIEVPLDLADSIAVAIYSQADMYRRDGGHSREGIASLHKDAERLDTIAEDIGMRAAAINARRGAKP